MKATKIYFTEQQLMDNIASYLTDDTANWSHGLRLLDAASKHFGAGLTPDFYEAVIRKVATLKPAIRGRELEYFPDNFIVPLDRIKQIVAEATKETSGSFTGQFDFGNHLKTKPYQQKVIRSLDDLEVRVKALLGGRAGIFKDFANRRILTFGSCFATNVGLALRELGASVYIMAMTEDINSPFNNRFFLRRVLSGEVTAASEEFQSVTSVNYDAIGEEFDKATDIVFTLGNIFHLEADGQHSLFLKTGTRLISDTVEQTTGYLREIFDLLSQHTKARLFVSVSPIPISGYQGTEFLSAMEADCASKCQLMTALRMSKPANVTYIPTFEIFKWFPPHQDFATIGVDDGSSRHIAKAHISMAMRALT